MFGWTIVFLVISLVAATFGFGGVAAASGGIAKVILIAALIGVAVSLVVGVGTRRK